MITLAERMAILSYHNSGMPETESMRLCREIFERQIYIYCDSLGIDIKMMRSIMHQLPRTIGYENCFMIALEMTVDSQLRQGNRDSLK